LEIGLGCEHGDLRNGRRLEVAEDLQEHGTGGVASGTAQARYDVVLPGEEGEWRDVGVVGVSPPTVPATASTVAATTTSMFVGPRTR
jgi:hypothetical protein